jgi:phage terminase large subunit GpA-like protein
MKHRCIECDAHAPKFRWLAGRGEFRPHRTHDERGNKILTRGFYLSGLCNPWLEWEILRDEFLRAVAANNEGDIEPLKAWHNTRMGSVFEDRGERVEVDLFKERREIYQSEIPDGVLVLTAGVDVGDYGLHYEVIGWGKGRESWGIEYGILDGNPREPDVWEMLDQAVLNRTFTTSDQKQMRVRKMCVDSGYASDFVYTYTKPRQPRAVSTKGYGGIGKPLLLGSTFTKGNRARLQILGVDTAKEEIVNRLRVSKPGPGHCHFPMLPNDEPARGYDQEYFKGLCAEQRVTKSKFGHRVYVWVKQPSQRNEPFDARILALAGLALLWPMRLDQMQRDDWSAADQSEQPQFGARQMMNAGIDPEPWGLPKSPFGAQNKGVW